MMTLSYSLTFFGMVNESWRLHWFVYYSCWANKWMCDICDVRCACNQIEWHRHLAYVNRVLGIWHVYESSVEKRFQCEIPFILFAVFFLSVFSFHAHFTMVPMISIRMDIFLARSNWPQSKFGVAIWIKVLLHHRSTKNNNDFADKL